MLYSNISCCLDDISKHRSNVNECFPALSPPYHQPSIQTPASKKSTQEGADLWTGVGARYTAHVDGEGVLGLDVDDDLGALPQLERIWRSETRDDLDCRARAPVSTLLGPHRGWGKGGGGTSSCGRCLMLRGSDQRDRDPGFAASQHGPARCPSRPDSLSGFSSGDLGARQVGWRAGDGKC